MKKGIRPVEEIKKRCNEKHAENKKGKKGNEK